MKVPICYSLNLTFILKYFWHFSSFANISQTVRDIANITIVTRLEEVHLPSNGGTANAVHLDIELHFRGHAFLNVNITIYQLISQTATDSRKIPTDLQSGDAKQ